MAPAERVAEYVAQGHDYLSRGLLPEAEEEFSDALAVNAQSAAALAGVAEVRERSGALADARSEALASNRMQPNVNAWLVLARLDLAQNLTGAAGDDVDNALKLEPRNAAALNLQQSIRGR
jgi:tetratricopeptide (TPR) repeat protein